MQISPSAPVEERNHRRALAAILALAAALPTIFFLGPRTGDDYRTIESAVQIRAGTYSPGDMPQTMRFGLLLPLALLQAVFGVNAFSSALPGVISAVLHAWSVWSVGRLLVSPAAGLAAAALLVLLPLSTTYSSTLYPDLPTAALGAAAFALLLGESKNERPRLGPILGAGALLGWAYLVKQTVVFLLLFLACWIARARLWRLAWAALPFALLFAAESLAFALLSGDPMRRSLQGNAFLAEHLLEYGGWRSGRPLLGLFTPFLESLFNPRNAGFIWFSGLAWPALAAFCAFRKLPWARFLGLLALAHLLLATLWPIRLHPYVPALVRAARHLSGMLLPLSVLAGAGWVALRGRLRVAAGCSFVVLSLASTALLWADYASRDAGLRAAINFVKVRVPSSVHAVDSFGNPSALARYRFGYAPSPVVQGYTQEDLPQLRSTWVIVEDVARIGSRAGLPRLDGRDLAIPPDWQEAWAGNFPIDTGPRRFLLGEGPATTNRVRIFRVP